MTYTQNYQLPQWVKSDRIMMDDFNDANSKIDTALHDLRTDVDTHETANTAALAAKGNCRVEILTYTGNGKYGKSNPTKIQFSALPKLVIIAGYQGIAFLLGSAGQSTLFTDGGGVAYPSMSSLGLTWSGTQASYYSTSSARAQLNTSGDQYWVVAFYAEGETE